MSEKQINDQESPHIINEKDKQYDINQIDQAFKNNKNYKKNNSKDKVNIYKVINSKTFLESTSCNHKIEDIPSSNSKENFENNKLDLIVKDKVIKKEKHNDISDIDKLDEYNLISQDILIKNSYEITLNLFHVIGHIVEAENKLKRHNKLLNKALQDILHKIESDKFNVVEGYKLAKKIQIIRNQKTLIRDNLAIYQQLNDLGIFNKNVLDNLNGIISEIEKNKDVYYEPKILKNLKFRYDNEKIYNKYTDIKKEDFKSIGIEDF